MMMMMMMMMVYQRKVVSLTSSRDHCHRSSPSQISDTPLAVFKPVQNLSPGLVESRYVLVVITTLHLNFALWDVISEIKKVNRELGLFFLYLINFLECSHIKLSFISWCFHSLMHNAIYLPQEGILFRQNLNLS